MRCDVATTRDDASNATTLVASALPPKADISGQSADLREITPFPPYQGQQGYERNNKLDFEKGHRRGLEPDRGRLNATVRLDDISAFEKWDPIFCTKIWIQKIGVVNTLKPTIVHSRNVKSVCPCMSVASRDAVRQRRPTIPAANITTLTAPIGAKGVFLNCKTRKSRKSVLPSV